MSGNSRLAVDVGGVGEETRRLVTGVVAVLSGLMGVGMRLE